MAGGFTAKKEFLAGILLVLIFVSSLINIGQIDKLSNQITNLISKTYEYAQEDDWTSAIKSAEDAIGLWHEKDGYTHIVLRHSQIDSITDALYDLLNSIYTYDINCVKTTAEKTIAQIKNLDEGEHINSGNIF